MNSEERQLEFETDERRFAAEEIELKEAVRRKHDEEREDADQKKQSGDRLPVEKSQNLHKNIVYCHFMLTVSAVSRNKPVVSQVMHK